MTAVRFYADGWRLGLVMTEGTRWLHLLDCGSLHAVKLPVEEARHFLPAEIRPVKLHRSLERRRLQFNRHGKQFAETMVKEAIAQLKA